jgi:hypothetical protein
MSKESWTSPCLDCGADTTPCTERDDPIPGTWEWYGVRTEVWRAARMKPKGGYLCIGCLEKRLGRQLVAADFKVPFDTDDLDTPRLADRVCRD